jgi:HSP20 family molecular chaperone IbpA
MTTGPSDDRPDDDRPNDNGGILGSIRRFLETIQEMEERGESVRHGRVSSDRGVADYSIHIGPARSDEMDDRAPQTEVSPDSPTSVRETEEGVVVHLDLPEAEGYTVVAGVDGRTLVVGTDEDEILTRVDLPRDGLTVIAGAYRNGVLELHLETETEANQDND